MINTKPPATLHTNILSTLAAFAKEANLIREKLQEFTQDLFVYSSKYRPECTEEDKIEHSSYIDEALLTLEVVSKYDWTGSEYPQLDKGDIRTLYCCYSRHYLPWLPEHTSKLDDFWAAAAAITGF